MSVHDFIICIFFSLIQILKSLNRMLRADFIIISFFFSFKLKFQELYMIMEKLQRVNILLLVLISLLPIAMCLQTEGGGITDERVKLDDEEDLHKVRL